MIPHRVHIMGVLNVTPDSFSDGGTFLSVDAAVAHGKAMVEDGADSIDVGGESSRPGSVRISVAEECQRVLPVIERLARDVSVPISIDTMKPEVAARAIAAGARIVNDITGLRDPAMIAVVAKAQARVIIMHMQGTPATMQANPTYGDVVADLLAFFRERSDAARAAGIRDIILDPGIGFGKTVDHNCTILRRLRAFTVLGCPILVGTSRKSFIGKITGQEVHDRLEGTIAANVLALGNGATMFRVHDVGPNVAALSVAEAIMLP